MKTAHSLIVSLLFAAPLALPTAQAQAQGSLPESCGPNSGLCWPKLQRGVRGYQTRTLQNLLLARGYRIGADGIFGTSTQTALRTYQKKHGLMVDGIAGWETWESLAPGLSRGARGRDVVALQTLLKMKHFPLTTDGIYGDATEKAVRHCQASYGFTKPNGRVNKLMWCQLVGGTIQGDY